MSKLRQALLDPLLARLGYVAKAGDQAGNLSPTRYDQSSENRRRGTDRGALNSFASLRVFADDVEPVRLAIQRRKAQLFGMKWDIVAREDADPARAEKQVPLAREFFGTSGGLGGPGRRFRSLLNAIVEDLLVLGAFATYRRPTRGGSLYSIEAIDAGTIKPELTPEGWVPEPPAPAFTQWIKSQQVREFTRDELWYETWDVRTYSRWTRSPVEYVMSSAIQFLAIETWNLSWFTTGDGEFTYWETPENWTPQQVKDFNAFLSTVKGDLEKKRGGIGALGVPGGPKRHSARPRSEAEYSETGLQLWRRIALGFDLNATVLGFEGQAYKVAQEGQASSAERWGNKPLCLLLSEYFSDVLLYDLELDAVEFRYDLGEEDVEKAGRTIKSAGPQYLAVNDGRDLLGMEAAEGPLVDCMFALGNDGKPVVLGWRQGADVPQEVRDRAIALATGAQSGAGEAGAVPGSEQGPLPGGSAEAATSSTDGAAGANTLPDGAVLADAARALTGKLSDEARADLARWRRKARNRAADGRPPAVSFASDHVPEPLAKMIADALRGASSPDEVGKIFDAALPAEGVDVRALSSDVRRLLAQVEEERGSRRSFAEHRRPSDGAS